MLATLFLLVILVVLLIFLGFFAYTMFFFFALPILFHGAIFAVSDQKRMKDMLALAQVAPGEKAVDLGSGDGRLVIALAQQGVEVHGYEINPFLVLKSRKAIRAAGLSNRATVHWKNFWLEDLSSFQLVTLYGITYIMNRLEKKLKQELSPNARVVSHYFTFSDWRPQKSLGDLHLYVKK